MTKLLRGIAPDLPPLRFETQQAEGETRPDMRGITDAETRVFAENKFWAGLSDTQPVSYLKRLAALTQPTVLLVVAPAARVRTLWRELNQRLRDEGIPVSEREAAAGIAQSATTQLGPILALTSWNSLLSQLEHETIDDPRARGYLTQLRALCDAADIDAYTPISGAELSDQRTPAFMLQLGSIVQEAVDLALHENVLDINKLMPQASWERIGRYARLAGEQGAGVWFGVHFGLWKSHGSTPFWLVFSDSDFGRAPEVRRLLEPWAADKKKLTTTLDHNFAIALDIPVGEEKARVVRSLVDDLKAIAALIEGHIETVHRNGALD